MKKKQFAQMQFNLRSTAQKVDYAAEALIDVIQKASSALATLDPELALGVIEHLDNELADIAHGADKIGDR
jgi:hypothetical protein